MRHGAAGILAGGLLLLASCDTQPTALLDYEFIAWVRLNETPITATIPGHGSGVRNIFINDVGTGVTRSTPEDRVVWDYPEGTVIIKTVGAPRNPDAPEPNGAPAMVLGMIKDSRRPENQGGWIWLTRDPVTGAERLFDTEFCVTCHADANERRTVSDRILTGVPNPEREFRDFVFYPYYATN